MFQRKKVLLICLAILLCCIVVGVGIFLYTQWGKTTVDWTLNGQIITADGTVTEEICVNVKGSITDRRNKNAKLTLDISFPSDFRYQDDEIKNAPNLIPDSVGAYYATISWAQKRGDSGVNSYLVCIDPEMGYFLCLWDQEDPDQCLVAATDENVSAGQILEHFQGFLAAYGFD